jgi:hypothetical protein
MGNKYGGASAPVSGFFVFLYAGQVLVRKWNPATEDFTSELDEEEVQRYVSGEFPLFDSLSCFPFSLF